MPPDSVSKTLAVTCCVLLAAFIGVGAYFVGVTKSAVIDTNFSVSQALAHGESIAMIVLFTGGLIALTWLIIYRGHNYLWFRVSLNIILGALIITIMWVSTDYNIVAHYALAGVIVVLLIIGTLVDNYVIYGRGYSCSGYIVITLISAALCTGAIVIALRSTGDINRDTGLQILAALELVLVATKLMSIITLGFEI